MTPGQIASYKAARAQYSVSADEARRGEEMRAHRVLLELMEQVPAGIRIGTWSIQGDTLDILLNGSRLTGHDIRGRVMQLAEQFGFVYDEADHGYGRNQNIVTAAGSYKGVPVKFWRLVPPCSCGDCEVKR